MLHVNYFSIFKKLQVDLGEDSHSIPKDTSMDSIQASLSLLQLSKRNHI